MNRAVRMGELVVESEELAQVQEDIHQYRQILSKKRAKGHIKLDDFVTILEKLSCNERKHQEEVHRLEKLVFGGKR